MHLLEQEGLKVLIAEDEPLVATVIEGELEAIGVGVIGKAADGMQAVALTKQLKPDVVLMDIEMPEMNGLAAARHIQAECPTPVVMLTVYAEQPTVRAAALAGVGAYLVKPPRSRELERSILVARARFEDLRELQRMNLNLQDTLAHVKRLQGILPICMYCHKIRTDKASWKQMEAYITQHSEATFSHGICPECMKRRFPEA